MGKAVVALASDHAGYDLKTSIAEELRRLGHPVVDLGAHDGVSVDYPDLGYALVRVLRFGQATRGVLVCGSGIGMSMAANRFQEIRAALVHDEMGARLARQHNDANVICFGGRVIGTDVACNCLRIFLETDFEGGRHCRRIEKLSNPL